MADKKVEEGTSAQPHEKHEKISSEDETKDDDPTRNMSFSSQKEAKEYERRRANAILANPLRGLSEAKLRKMGKSYALGMLCKRVLGRFIDKLTRDDSEHALVEPEDFRAFELGAVLAQNPKAFERVQGLTPEELEILKREFTHRWSQPRLLYLVIVLCSTCAAGEFSQSILFSEIWRPRDCIRKTCANNMPSVCSPRHGRNRCKWRSTLL